MLFVQPFTMVLLTHYVYGHAGSGASFYVMFGSGMSGMWVATAFSSAGDLGRERGYGTIQPVLASGVPLWVVSAGRACGALALSVVPVVTSTLASVFVFRTPVPDELSVVGMLLGVAAFGIGCHSFGLVLGHLFLLSRRTVVLQNFLEWPLIIVSGVIVPLTALPTGVRWFSAVLPMRWGTEAAERSFSEGVIPWPLLGAAVGIAAIYFAAAVALSHAIERRVRTTAGLEVI
ncbi:ABC transporter permease [Streptomyces radicis]|uniref:ABC transporter permease n=2 Tax=Streptomyces radicis TaxID=1750517 RepID=A0A3A9WE06_9ACTN|nr:ABC transporter permease [Streptomyces radicis]RKN14775.1 ABC transporter permease [Streptomyces radicis]